MIGGTTALFVMVGFFVIRTQGSVSGTEFAPTHFQQREFSFYEIPLIHLQITPIKRISLTNDTARYLRQKSLIKTPPGVPAVWHLAELSNVLSGQNSAPPMLLVDQLNMHHRNKSFWLEWSKSHPAHAAILWPAVQRLAKRELYVLLPSLLEIAAIDQTTEELDQRIQKHLADEYEGLITDMRDAKRVDLASELLTEAKRDFPSDPRWSKFHPPALQPTTTLQMDPDRSGPDARNNGSTQKRLDLERSVNQRDTVKVVS